MDDEDVSIEDEIADKVYYFDLSDNERLTSWKNTLFPNQYLYSHELEDLKHIVFRCS
jgi:hypothetical protein